MKAFLIQNGPTVNLIFANNEVNAKKIFENQSNNTLYSIKELNDDLKILGIDGNGSVTIGEVLKNRTKECVVL